MADETTALLIRARSFIDRGWCTGPLARTRDGRPISPDSPHAVAWCAWGALSAAGAPIAEHLTHPAFVRLQAAVGKENVPFFNDHQKSVEPVLAAFDRAIAAAEPTR